MKGEMIPFLATDNLILHGFLSKPKIKSDKVVLHIHGLEGSFYQNDFVKVLSNLFTKNGFNFFTIELRGSYNIWGIRRKIGRKTKEILVGGDLEKFEECIYDIKGAIRFLKSIGMKHIFLQGHSTGCQKTTYYLSMKKDPSVKGLILISPCDDYNIYKRDLGKKFNEVVKFARKNLRKNPKLLISMKYPKIWLSVSRFLSLCNLKFVESRLFNYDLKKLNEFSKIKIPILAIFGTKEQYTVKPVKEYLEILKKNTNSTDFKSALVKNANHGFVNRENQLARIIVKWLRSF